MNFQEFKSPKFIKGVASGVLAALILDSIIRIVQNTLKYEVASFYMMGLIALICLILVVHFLIRIQELVENRNYTRFIPSKRERLNLMTECIKKAKTSIYILSDLSNIDETRLQEHEKYIEALNQVIKDNKGSPGFEVKRIVVPSNTISNDADSDPNWIYKTPVIGAYLEHFKLLRDFDKVSPKHKNGPRNVSVILIDKRHLFWKPELAFEEEALDSLLDGGIYLEDYSREGMAEFSKRFKIMFEKAQFTELENFDSTKP
jgi:hypothetical protein